MTTRARELPRVLDLPAKAGLCLTCSPRPRDRVTASTLWAWSLAHPGQPPFRQVRSVPSNPHPKEDP